MKKRDYLLIGIAVLSVIFVGIKEVPAFTIDFEDLTDSTAVTNQYSGLGVDFSDATVITAGETLNEFEFPPNSGTNAAFDDGGPMVLTFSLPMANFSAYFTYLMPLTLSFYDALNNLENTVNSAYSSNLALSGDLGSSPNELLSFASVAGFVSVIIAGDSGGSSFTMDDVTANPASVPVPEPSTLLLFMSGVLGLIMFGRVK